MDKYTAQMIINKYNDLFYKILFDEDTNVFKIYTSSWEYSEANCIAAEKAINFFRYYSNYENQYNNNYDDLLLDAQEQLLTDYELTAQEVTKRSKLLNTI